MVFIAEQFEDQTSQEQNGCVPEISSVTDSGSKNTDSSSKPWVGWRLTFEFCNHGKMFVDQRRQSNIVSSQERFK